MEELLVTGQHSENKGKTTQANSGTLPPGQTAWKQQPLGKAERDPEHGGSARFYQVLRADPASGNSLGCMGPRRRLCKAPTLLSSESEPAPGGSNLEWAHDKGAWAHQLQTRQHLSAAAPVNAVLSNSTPTRGQPHHVCKRTSRGTWEPACRVHAPQEGGQDRGSSLTPEGVTEPRMAHGDRRWGLPHTGHHSGGNCLAEVSSFLSARFPPKSYQRQGHKGSLPRKVQTAPGRICSTLHWSECSDDELTASSRSGGEASPLPAPRQTALPLPLSLSCFQVDSKLRAFKDHSLWLGVTGVIVFTPCNYSTFNECGNSEKSNFKKSPQDFLRHRRYAPREPLILQSLCGNILATWWQSTHPQYWALWGAALRHISCIQGRQHDGVYNQLK